MRVRVSGSFALTLLLWAIAPGHAQVAPLGLPPPAPGFVSSYEIMHTLRSAGFDPLAPPLREGTTYVARATDYRGILMRVVLDARTGAIRDANRIVSRPDAAEVGPYGQVGMLPPDDMSPPYGAPPDFDAETAPPGGRGVGPLPASPSSRQAPRATVTIFPPLPRPRPSELATGPSDPASPGLTPHDAPAPAPNAKAAAALVASPVAKTDVTNSTAPVPAKPASRPPGAPIND